MTSTRTAVQIFTSAPEGFDGFGTVTVAVLGVDRFTGFPVRAVSVAAEHLDWQTDRYRGAANLPYRYTDATRRTVAGYLKFGSWALTPETFRGARVAFRGDGGTVDNAADDGTVAVRLDSGGGVVAHLDSGLITFARPAPKAEGEDE